MYCVSESPGQRFYTALHSMVSAWMWMIVAENLLCMRIYIDNYFWEAFIIYVEGHKNSIFADKGHSNF